MVWSLGFCGLCLGRALGHFMFSLIGLNNPKPETLNKRILFTNTLKAPPSLRVLEGFQGSRLQGC